MAQSWLSVFEIGIAYSYLLLTNYALLQEERDATTGSGLLPGVFSQSPSA
jgi:hypothetical protein